MKLSKVKYVFGLFLICLFLTSGFTQSKLDKGMVLYNNGDYSQAIEILKKDRSNISSLYYLGLSFEKIGKKKEAGKSYKKSVDKCSSLVVNQLSKNVRKIKSVEIRNRIKDKYMSQIDHAVLSSRGFFRLRPADARKQTWKNKLIVIRLFSGLTHESERLFSDDEVSKKIRVISKPAPNYSNLARENRTTGQISVLVGLLRNGQIGFAVPLGYLPNGLTERVLTAAKRIRFKPAEKDGKPVTQIKRIRYTFYEL